ncbi:hypothetical protein WS71_22105 [Burkholderia mayonis]|uniref:Uncharacterized protein n=1 Tax=Burkholderia mayonis TaxID=1385591 RepID=A0A1B4G215_9BURK|nr:hypothetical protein WS71_22105 [Burkholderia mayonis]KVE58686.1 hypothetical protein WS71_24060 [Burkholderia mayonis]
MHVQPPLDSRALTSTRAQRVDRRTLIRMISNFAKRRQPQIAAVRACDACLPFRVTFAYAIHDAAAT